MFPYMPSHVIFATLHAIAHSAQTRWHRNIQLAVLYSEYGKEGGCRIKHIHTLTLVCASTIYTPHTKIVLFVFVENIFTNQDNERVRKRKMVSTQKHTVGKYDDMASTGGSYNTHTHTQPKLSIPSPMIMRSVCWFVRLRSAIWMEKRKIRMVLVAHKITSCLKENEKKRLPFKFHSVKEEKE